jgi:hypothetical protein
MMAPVQFAPQSPAAQPIPPMPVQNVAAEPQPRPRIRLQAADDPARATPRNLSLPPPETLGLTPKTVQAKVDWNVARARLQQLGATNFRADCLGAEGYRVRILLTSPAGSLHEIETTAATEAAAVEVALQESEHWKKAK